ncbi:Membrane protein, putative [Minicystis rosea]|nr:Membrane protein, putative [Minicystis rosea]
MPSSPLTALALTAVAFGAGVIDAIAGGGGLLTVPALLVATGDARITLGTNKGQAVFGSFSAFVSFFRAGRIHRGRLVPTFLAALAGSVVGVRLVLALRPETLRPVVLALLAGVAVFFAARGRRKPGTAPSKAWAVAEKHPALAAAGIGLSMGIYDGFFGPGVGTFLIALFVAVFGDDMTAATANAKVANFASNLGSVVLFAFAGKIDPRLALPMAAAQIVGGTVGARLAMRGGERLVRAGVLLVTTALVVRLAWQMTAARAG